MKAAIAAVSALLVAVALYPTLRGIQLLLYPEANPATVVWTAHAGYFWRVWICAFGGALAGLVVFSLGEPARARLVRALPMCAAVACALLVLQAVFLP